MAALQKKPSMQHNAFLRVFGNWDRGADIGGGMPLPLVSATILEHLLDKGQSTTEEMAVVLEETVRKRERLERVYAKSHKMDGDVYFLFTQDIIEIMQQSRLVTIEAGVARLRYEKDGGKFKLRELIRTAKTEPCLEAIILPKNEREENNKLDKFSGLSSFLRMNVTPNPNPTQRDFICKCPKCDFTMRASKKRVKDITPACPFCLGKDEINRMQIEMERDIERQVIDMCYQGRRSQKEVAATLGISTNKIGRILDKKKRDVALEEARTITPEKIKDAFVTFPHEERQKLVEELLNLIT